MNTPTPLRCSTAAPSAATARIALHGDLDYPNVRVLQDAASAALREPGLRSLVLDCAQLTFIDSSGLSALLRVHRDATAARVEVVLDERPERLENMLRLTGLHALFTSARGHRASWTSDAHS